MSVCHKIEQLTSKPQNIMVMVVGKLARVGWQTTCISHSKPWTNLTIFNIGTWILIKYNQILITFLMQTMISKKITYNALKEDDPTQPLMFLSLHNHSILRPYIDVTCDGGHYTICLGLLVRGGRKGLGFRFTRRNNTPKTTCSPGVRCGRYLAKGRLHR